MDPKTAVESRMNHNINPHILQISFVIFDTQFWRVVTSYDAYIKVAADIEISPKITEITGISRTMCNECGIDISDAMHEFYKAYVSCDAVVAHNLDFDREMVLIEMARLNEKYEDNKKRRYIFSKFGACERKRAGKSQTCTHHTRRYCK